MLDFILTLLLFSSMEVVSKPLMGHIHPFALTLGRFILGWAVLGVLFVARGESRRLRGLSVSNWALLVLLGLLNTFVAMSLLQFAVQNSNAGTAAAIICSNPAFVFLFAVLLGMQAFRWRKLLGLAIALGGVLLVSDITRIRLSTGALYALAAAAVFALYAVLNKKIVHRVGPLALNFVSFTAGIWALAGYMLISDRTMFIPDSAFLHWKPLLSLLYLGIAVSGIGYITFMRTVDRYSPLSASLIFLLKPAVAAILAWLALGEIPSDVSAVGMGLISIGSLLTLEKVTKNDYRKAKGEIP